jgi:hypothetical protein
MNKRAGIVILFILVGMLQTATALERTRLGLVKEGEFSFLTGLEYQEGDYGAPDSTSLWRLPVSISYRKTNFSLFASMPLLYATSEGDVIISNKTSTPKKGRLPPSSGTEQTEQQTESGIGDIVLSGSYYFTADFRNEIIYRLTTAVKLGTADEAKGLGTGENDFSLEGGVVKYIDEYIISGTLGYEIIGDSSVFNYNNILYGTVGLTRQLATNKQIGSLLYFSQALTDVSDEPLELSIFYSQPVGKTNDIYLYLSKGLSDGSPDFAAGGTIQFHY